MKLRSAAIASIVALLALMYSCNQVKAANHTVTLSWGAASVSGVCVITAYNVYRSTTPGGEGGPTSTPPTFVGKTSGTPLALTFTDTNVVSGQTYYYKVGGFGPSCSPTDGPLSNEAKAVIPADPAVMTAPPNATAVVN